MCQSVRRKLKEPVFSERIYLDQICRYSGLSKSTLFRAFTKSKGITPYRYLETIRINKAKQLLEKGILPIDAAIQTGSSDQSYFSSFIGLTPGVYREIFSEKTRKKNRMRNKRIGHLAALLTIMIWGTTFISTKILLTSFKSVEILFFRFVYNIPKAIENEKL